MILTEAQKPVFRRIYIPGVVAAALYLLVYFLQKPYDADQEAGGGSSLDWIYQFLFPLLLLACWGWDWLVQQQYQKLSRLAMVAVLHWLLVFEMDMYEKIYAAELKDGGGRLLLVLRPLLLSPAIWYGVARGAIENRRNTLVAGYFAGLVLSLAESAMYSNAYRINDLTGYVNRVFEFVFGDGLFGRWWIQHGQIMVLTAFFLLMAPLTMWLYYLARNILTDRVYNYREIFVTGHYNYTGGVHFAMLYPFFYLACFTCACAVAENLLPLFRAGGAGKLKPIHVLNVVCYGCTLYIFFRLIRDLVISRCITLRQRAGFMYYLALIPVFNFIAYCWFAFAKKEEDENERIAYAAQMNDPETARDRLTTWFIMFVAMVPVLVMLFPESRSTYDFEVLGMLLAILQVVLLGIMMSQPKAKYWLAGLQVVLFFITIHSGDSDRRGQEDVFNGLLKLLYAVMALNWYEKIFHPDVFMDVDYGFGQAAEKGAAETDITENVEKADNGM